MIKYVQFCCTHSKKGATDHMDGDPYSNRKTVTAVRSNRTHG